MLRDERHDAEALVRRVASAVGGVVRISLYPDDALSSMSWLTSPGPRLAA
jgi:hypothetical protein